MSRAELCPVCKGSGKYDKERCHGCTGKGWIELKDESIFSKPSVFPRRYERKMPFRIGDPDMSEIGKRFRMMC